MKPLFGFVRVASLLLACVSASCSRAPPAGAPSTAPRVSPSTAGPPAPPAVPTPSLQAEIPKDPALYLLAVFAEFAPESINAIGLPGHEDDILDLAPDVDARFGEALARAIGTLERGRDQATEASTKQDFDIVLAAARLAAEQQRIERRVFVSHDDVAKTVFTGLRANLGPGARTAHATTRLSKYTASPSIFERARARTEKSLENAALLYPSKRDLEDELRDLDVYMAGLVKLFAERKVVGHEARLAVLVRDAKGYAAWVREKLLPRARDDFRLPLEVYDFRLRKNGVSMPRPELEVEARAAYGHTLREMEALAKPGTLLYVVAGWKKQVKSGDALVALYEKRIVDLEKIVAEHQLVTLPTLKLHVRLASEAETAENPSPTIDVQALFKKGAAIDMILPQSALPSNGVAVADLAYTDFTFDAASWSIAAHEGRPGHELQFTSLKERGLSLSRTLFAFNGVNVEGWGLYAERMVYPYLPKDAKLALLRMRALREARAYLDPGLHDGTVSVEEARRVIGAELGFSAGVTKQELDRYTYKSPAQATAYFYGLTKLVALRAECEKLPGFTPRRFHDAYLGAGLLPPELMAPVVKGALARPVAARTESPAK